LQTYLNWRQVLARLKYAMDHHKSFSLVRIGDGENICLAQNSVWTMHDVLKQPWVKKANIRGRGVNLPNISLRNKLVQAIRRANVVGILPRNDRRIHAPQNLKRPLTDKVFAHFSLKPNYLCDACINRYVPKYHDFWDLLNGRKILLITKHARLLKRVLVRKYGVKVAGTIYFSNYRQINRVLRVVEAKKNQFDLALISAGVSAVILAPKVAHISGKVAIDFGEGHRAFSNRSKVK